MQFRQRGNKIQVYKYAGYDTEKKRAKMEFLGSMDLEGLPNVFSLRGRTGRTQGLSETI